MKSILGWIADFAIDILKGVAKKLSPHIRSLLEDFVQDFSENAKLTPNPFDDMLANFLLDVLDIKEIE